MGKFGRLLGKKDKDSEVKDISKENKGVKKKEEFHFVLELPERHCSTLTEKQLDSALKTLARFALKGMFDKLDPGGRIPIEDCSLSIDSEHKCATLIISIPVERRNEILAASTAVYKDLLGEIDRWGIDQLIATGRKTYG